MSTKNEQNGAMGYLFSKTKRGVLELLFRQPEKSFYTNEIVRLVGTGTGAVQKEMKEITAAGLVTRERMGNLVLYKANPNLLIINELVSIVVKMGKYSPVDEEPNEQKIAKSLKLITKNFSGEKVTGFCRRNHVQKMSLFGEVLKDNFLPEAGIDVLVEFEAGHEPGEFELSDLEEQFSGQAGQKVNLHNVKDMIGFKREEAGRGGFVVFDDGKNDKQ